MKTGIAFIPGTFPTGKVLDAVREGLPVSAENWNRTKINDMYFLYKEGVESGKPIVQEGDFSIKEYMMENSNYTEAEIRVFLYILLELAKAGDIEQKWWNINLQENRGFLKDSENLLKVANKASSAIMWASIAGIVAGGIYFLYPYLKRRRVNQNG